MIRLAPTGVAAIPSAQRIAAVDSVTKMAADVAFDAFTLRGRVIIVETGGVVVVIEHQRSRIVFRLALRVSEVGVDIEVELLICKDIGDPGLGFGEPDVLVGAGSTVEAERDELIAVDLLVGDDIDDGGAATVACRGVGDNLDFLYAVGWQHLDVLLECLAVHVAGAVIDPDIHALGAV